MSFQPDIGKPPLDADDTTLDQPVLASDVEKNGSEPDEPEDSDASGSPPERVLSAMSSIPDGGTAAWLVVLGTWCTSVCSFGWLNSVGVFQAYYEAGPLRAYSSSTIAWIPSLQIFFMMAMGPVVGRLFDAYGPRYLILGGSFLHVFGLMMASLSTTYYQLLLSQGVCSAIGVSAIFQPALGCIPGWFSHRRGLAYGTLATGSSLGGVVFPIMVNRLVRSVGYGWAMRASAFLILGLLVVANVTVRSRLHQHGARGRRLTRAQMAAPFREFGFACLLVGMFLLTFGIYVPITYLSVQAVATGNVDENLALYLVAILNAASLFGRLLSGWAADAIGKFNVFLVSCASAGIVVLALWIPGTSKSAILAFAVLFGFFSGAYISLIASLVAQISPPKEIGYRTGLTFLVSSVPGLVTSPIAGAILARHGDWVGVKVFAGVFILAGSLAVLLGRLHLTGFKLLTVF